MTSRRETNHNSHSSSPRIFVFGASRDATIRDTIAPLNFRDADKNSSPRRILFHFGNLWQQFQTSRSSFLQSAVSQIGTARSRSAIASQVQSISTSLIPVAFVRGQSCMEHRRGARNSRVKSPDQLVVSQYKTPTIWSNLSSPKSPKRFGLRTLRLRSQRFVAAAFAPLNATSADNENGPATRSPSSSPKSSVVTKCATSRSFPNGRRRPF